MTTFLVTSKDGAPRFDSPYNEARFRKFFKDNEGKHIRMEIETDDRETEEKRRFWEGAIVPYYFYQNPKSGWKDFAECREALKLHHNAKWIRTVGGKDFPIPQTTKMSNKKFVEFIEKVERDFMQNGFLFPDPDTYKIWRDSAPMGEDAEFPPLAELRKAYESESRASN